MTWILAGLAAAAGCYQILATIAALVHLRARRFLPPAVLPVISILKPVRGADPGFYEAIRSHALQKYPHFEILFGIGDPADSARPQIERLIAEFPAVSIRLIVCNTKTPNGKVGTLIDLASEARSPVLIVNDSDITVPVGYLSAVTAPLAEPEIGLVTCLYRAEANNWPSRFEALAIATEFAPSTLVAPLFGVSEFALGSTLAFRRADLDAIGGFRAIADYLADDYQLGHKIHALGRKNVLSDVVVSTRIAAPTWSAAWRHQLRWARTIRLSRPGGYAGLPITFATLWTVAAAAGGLWRAALALLAVRLLMALVSGVAVLKSADVWKYLYVVPMRDLWGIAVWVAGLFGDTVEWRGLRLRLDREGRIRTAADP